MEQRLSFLQTVITLVVGVMLGIAVLVFAQSKAFGNHQHLGQIIDRYESCKAKVPDTMDCIMVPMAVSVDFIKEITQEEAANEQR